MATAPSVTQTTLEALFRPGQIGSMSLRNRLVQSPVFTQYATTWGEASNRLIEYHRARARGGVGLIITENTSIDWEIGRTVGNPIRLDHDRFRTALGELTEAVHNEGGKIAVQLHHTGRQNSRANIETGEPPISASDGPASLYGDPPRGVHHDEIAGLIEKYAAAARRAVLAKFDAVELHGAHGYLLGQFLSPKTNRRTDEYGGPLENRARFALEVVDAVRAQVGPDFPILYRLSVEEPYEGGLPLEDGLRFCEMLEQRGIDALDVSAGNYDTVQTLIPLAPPGSLIDYAKAVKERVDIPVIGVGRMVWILDEAAQAIEDGELDFVALGRGQLAEPELANKLRSGAGHRIRRCIACNECIGVMFEGLHTPCTINPELGHEGRAVEARRPAVRAKDVVIVGAGPAGCQGAILAAQRGHNVTLLEQGERIGGQLHAWAAPGFRQREIHGLIDFYETELAAAGVALRLGVRAEIGDLDEHDIVLLATGTEPEGVPEGSIDAVEMLTDGQPPASDTITVVGDGTVAMHAALWLAEQGKETTIRCQGEQLGTDINNLLAEHLTSLLNGAGVKIITGTTASGGGGPLVWAGPRRARRDFAERENGTTVLPIGTRLRGGLLYAATQSGYWTAARL